jgi:putative PIN family toxin of toxin-antitoxin system
MDKFSIVLDTSVLVSAPKSKRGASYNILTLIRSEKFAFHLSVPLVCEYESVLKRSGLIPHWSTEEIDELLDIICFFGVKHDIWYLWRPMLQEAGDEFVAELAVTAQVDAIVTHNVRDFKGREKFGIKVMTAKEFLYEIGEAQ